MKVKLMGIQTINFINEETGEQICGKKLHVVAFAAENDNQMNGYRVASVWTKLPVPEFKPGDIFELEYQQRLGSNKSFLSAITPIKG